MKNSKLMRAAVLATAAITLCGVVQAQTDKQAMKEAQTDKAVGQGTPEADKVFLYKATQGSMGEIELSQMELKTTKNPDLQTYAQQMITDHQKLIADTKPFADQMSVKTPTKLNVDDEIEAKRMKSEHGDKRDMEYVKAMVAGHHKTLALMMTERDTTTNTDLKPVVAQGTDVVKQHTDMIDGIAQKMNIPTPPTPAPAAGTM